MLEKNVVLFVQWPVKELQVDTAPDVKADMLRIDKAAHRTGEADDDAFPLMDIRHHPNSRVAE